jgi:hypothetical protein
MEPTPMQIADSKIGSVVGPFNRQTDNKISESYTSYTTTLQTTATTTTTTTKTTDLKLKNILETERTRKP